MNSLKQILVVEDDPDIQKILRLALETVGGFKATVTGSGQEALAALDRCQPDLLLLDVMMPGMDGPTTLSQIRQRAEHRDTPAIFLTAKAQTHEVAHLLALGALAVIAKPFDPMGLAAELRQHWQKARAAEPPATEPKPELSLETSIEALRLEFIAEIPQRMGDIARLWQALTAGRAKLADLQELIRLIHSLAGTSRTYGFDSLGLQAKEIEKALQAHHDQGSLPGADAQRALVAQLSALERQAKQATQAAPPQPAAAEEVPTLPLQAKALVYLLEDDPAQAAVLAAQLGLFGYRIRHFQETTPLLESLEQERPAAMVFDIMLKEGPMGGIELARRLSTGEHGDIPIVFVSSRDDITARLEAVRAGCSAYLLKPVDANKLVDVLDNLLKQALQTPYRILIVEDQDALARHIETLLQDAGLETSIVSHPLEALQAINNYNPDLILMDMYMPDCSGEELAKLIRQHGQYDSLPIVFLSSEQNLDIQMIALRTGADDFLTKPIDPKRLVHAVRIRAERFRLLNSLMVRDSMTGLLNHARSKEALAAEIARARRNNTPLSVAMIDIDKFKAINDKHGHPVGDRVIKSLARLIQERLRSTDVGGRYGGEEFIMVLPNCPQEQAAQILNDLRIRFGRIRHSSDKQDQEFTATFSAGVASFPTCNSAESLLMTADAALYQAKKRGRNRVIMATGEIGYASNQ
ncbi:response regulator receiver modulated diguanylate cyclase [Sulfuritortus calidifontis]|uniref:Response regulator receiver modulated diguanylate cyclase n=1 Tax=Sulfuritortus calidifontis TaxID=1914471 RepID=A0A4R3JUH4_9PROT|nr:response regulator [Sulfuritortus calidifontis]TCS71338.1 response regulator receiver modulated diguanylate cyclase [Sulfuritortus calidifontis]